MGSLVLALVILLCARWFFRSGLADAVGESIRHRHGVGADRQVVERLDELADRMDAELGALRAEVLELSERVDFTERALVQARNPARLPEPGSPS